MNRSAMPPQRRTYGADARAAGALLPPKFASRAAHFALVLGLVGARAQAAQIPPRSLMQKVRIHLRAKHGIRQFHLADLLAIQINNIDDRHNFVSFSITWPTSPCG